MAINSYGYPGTIAPGSIMAQFSGHGFGHRYSVAGYSDWRVTAATSGTRQINIAAGWAMGKGVMVQNTDTITYSLPAPSGTTQWMLVGLRRWNGASPYTSVVTHVLGTSTRAVPAVTQTPGSNDTQWLALCRVTSTSTLVPEVVDLRLISTEGAGFYVCHSDLAQAQLDDVVGAEVYRADTTGGHVPSFYKRIVTLGGVLTWQNMSAPDVVLTGNNAVQAAPEHWGRNAAGCRMVRSGGQRGLITSVNLIGGSPSFTSNGRGGITDQIIAAVYEFDRPPYPISWVGELKQGTNTTHAVFGRITQFGNIMLTSMLPDVTVSPGDDIDLAVNYWVS